MLTPHALLFLCGSGPSTRLRRRFRNEFEQIADAASKLSAELRDLSQVHFSRAIIVEEGDHVSMYTREPRNVGDPEPLTPHDRRQVAAKAVAFCFLVRHRTGLSDLTQDAYYAILNSIYA